MRSRRRSRTSSTCARRRARSPTSRRCAATAATRVGRRSRAAQRSARSPPISSRCSACARARHRLFPRRRSPGHPSAHIILTDASGDRASAAVAQHHRPTIRLDDQAYTIVGVMPPRFDYPGGLQRVHAARRQPQFPRQPARADGDRALEARRVVDASERRHGRGRAELRAPARGEQRVGHSAVALAGRASSGRR